MAKEEEKIITINGQDYLYNDLRDSIGTWGREQGPKYKKWGKEGTNILEDTYGLLDEMMNGTLEYNGSHFIDYNGEDRNRKKKNIKSNSKHGNYRNAAAFVLSQVIRGATPITKGTQEDFEDLVHKEIARQIGSIENFLKLDRSDEDIWPITNRYQSMTNVLNNLISNEESYNKKYNIDEGYFGRLTSAYNAFEDSKEDNNEMNLLEQLFSDKKNYIDNNYFKTDFSTPKTEESSVEEPTVKEPVIEEDTVIQGGGPIIEGDTSFDSWLNNNFKQEENPDITEFKYKFSKKDNDWYTVYFKNLNNDVIINHLKGSIYKKDNNKTTLYKTIEEKGLDFDTYIAYLWRTAADRGILKQIGDTKEYYCPFIIHNRNVLVYTKTSKEDKTGPTLKWKSIKDIPEFKDKLKEEYNKNHSFNIDNTIKKFFV